MRGTVFIALGALAATACNPKGPADSNEGIAVDVNVPEPVAAPQGKPVALKSETPLLSWEVSWPAEVNAIPALEKLIREPAEKALADYTREAKADRAERQKQGFDFNSYDYSDTFEVVGQTPQLLSLTREWMNYTGGAHPNHGTEAILWNKDANKPVKLADLIGAGGAVTLDRLYRDSYCKALNEERAKRREGLDASTGPDDPFGQCPKLDELHIVPKGNPKGGPMDVLWFHADPYVAGPYAEGDYDIELRVNAAFIAALAPAYRASFTAR